MKKALAMIMAIAIVATLTVAVGAAPAPVNEGLTLTVKVDYKPDGLGDTYVRFVNDQKIVEGGFSYEFLAEKIIDAPAKPAKPSLPGDSQYAPVINKTLGILKIAGAMDGEWAAGSSMGLAAFDADEKPIIKNDKDENDEEMLVISEVIYMTLCENGCGEYVYDDVDECTCVEETTPAETTTAAETTTTAGTTTAATTTTVAGTTTAGATTTKVATSTSKPTDSPKTGVTIALIPTILAAGAAIVASRKRK